MSEARQRADWNPAASLMLMLACAFGGGDTPELADFHPFMRPTPPAEITPEQAARLFSGD
jgi:hypothetical protein